MTTVFASQHEASALSEKFVDAAPSAEGGHWSVLAKGEVLSSAGAKHHGDTASMKLNKPITAIAATPLGNGYWLAAEDGGVFAYGDAKFHGAANNSQLIKPIVAIEPPYGEGTACNIVIEGGALVGPGANSIPAPDRGTLQISSSTQIKP